MKKSIEKLKVRIDQNLNRAEKSELLSEDLIRIEEKVSSLKQVCQSVSKKLAEGPGANHKGSDGAALEKRIRKTNDFMLGQTIQENGRLINRKESQNVLGQFLVNGGQLLTDLATNQIQYEIEVEKLVLHNLNTVLENSVPQISKEKRNLERLVLDLDTVKSRLVNLRAKETPEEGREEKLLEELHEMQTKVDQTRDSLASMMLQFLAMEPQIGRVLLRYFQIKKDYHYKVGEELSQKMDTLEQLIDSSVIPVFGCDIHSHLQKMNRRIALPLQICVCRLLQLGLQEEGLFRIASSVGRVKRLKGMLDAGEWTWAALCEITDPHIFSAVLKTYLRELPVPLLYGNYDDWIAAGDTSTHNEKCERIKELVDGLPEDYYDNLNYLVAFLHRLSKEADENKMTISNISIVLSPNLLWDSNEDLSGNMNMRDTQIINNIVELLIEHVDWFFDIRRGEIDFFAGLDTEDHSAGNHEALTPKFDKRRVISMPPAVETTKRVAPALPAEHSPMHSPRLPVPTPRGSKLKPSVPTKPVNLGKDRPASLKESESTNL